MAWKTPQMIRAFMDASVLFSAAFSPSGASRAIIREGIRGNAALVVSDFVIEETKRNLRDKRPDTLPVLQEILEAATFKMITPTTRDVSRAAIYTTLKDAPVVAAARKARVDYLTSLDRKHLVNAPEVAQRSGLKIVLPEQLLAEIRKYKSSPEASRN